MSEIEIEEGFGFQQMKAKDLQMRTGDSATMIVLVIQGEKGIEVYGGPKKKEGLRKLPEAKALHFITIYRAYKRFGVNVLALSSGKQMTREQAMSYLPAKTQSAHEAALNA